MSALHFMKVRLIRLYPLYFLALLLAVVQLLRVWIRGKLGDTRTVLLDVTFALFFLPSPASAEFLFPLNVPAWSLFFELAANAAFGLFGSLLSTRALAVAVAAAGFFLIFAVSFEWLGFGSAGIGAMADGFQWHGFGAGLARVAFSFFAGVLIFRVWQANRPRFQVPSFAVAAALTAILVVSPPDRFQSAFDLTAVLFIFPFIIFFGATSVPTGIINRVCSRLGAASYSIYVLQGPLYGLAFLTVYKLMGRADQLSLIWGGGFVVLTFVIALVSDIWFDQPIRRKLSSAIGRRVVRH
jgi:peptidoglycan/LPS O-acetylase OafA/YrhL